MRGGGGAAPERVYPFGSCARGARGRRAARPVAGADPAGEFRQGMYWPMPETREIAPNRKNMKNLKFTKFNEIN